MFKLILVAIVTYFAYSFYVRYNIAEKFKKSSEKKNSKNNFSKMDIRDADFKDIDEN